MPLPWLLFALFQFDELFNDFENFFYIFFPCSTGKFERSWSLYIFYFFPGDAGGQLGLVLGASFITLLEVIDLLIMFAINWFRSYPRLKTADIS